MISFNLYSMWWADVVYEDDPNTFKNRPVLIVGKANLKGSKKLVAVAMKITKHDVRDSDDIDLLDWNKKPEGLRCKSTVRTSKIFLVDPNLITDYIGTLSNSDILRVKSITTKKVIELKNELKSSGIIEKKLRNKKLNLYYE